MLPVLGLPVLMYVEFASPQHGTQLVCQKTLATVDTFAKDLHESLEARNLTDIVDIIFVSDHGMTDTSHPELVYIDDILGAEGFNSIEHQDGESPVFASYKSVHRNQLLFRLAVYGPTLSPWNQRL